MITSTVLRAVMPHAALSWLDPLQAAMSEYSIDTPTRGAMFFAQIAHESAGLTQLVENLNYSVTAIVEAWPTRFTDQTALAYAHNPERLANLVYANRMGNGDVASGDGWAHIGRGPMMLTGKNAYHSCFFSLGVDLDTEPERVATDIELGARSAAWAWASSGCNQLADAGDFRATTHAINGGYIGQAQREALFVVATRAFS